MEYEKGRIYPNAVPEFRMFQKENGMIEMQVRYINSVMGYIGKWQAVEMKKENDTASQLQA